VGEKKRLKNKNENRKEGGERKINKNKINAINAINA
jgi:hypothetical protein